MISIIVLLIVSAITLGELFRLIEFYPEVYNIDFNTPCNPQFRDNCLFLFWSISWMREGILNPNYSQFHFGNWRFTTDRNRIKEADVVIFHHNEIKYFKYPHRPKNQIWIWFNLESHKRFYNYKLLKDKFNYTATYNHRSDILVPYGFFIPLKTNTSFTTKYFKPFKEKPKLVAWIVSHNEKTLERVIYYNEFKNYIKIDTYGRAFNRNVKGAICDVISQYKFYLAFENSIVEDYITEKLYYNSYICGAVPVVLGTTRENYVSYGIPNDSFIHVNDFPNSSELAKYLLKVGNNETLYNSYLEWRNKYEVRLLVYSHSYFYIMEQLYHRNLKPKIIDDLEFYFPE